MAFKSIILGPNDRVIMAENEYAGNAVAAKSYTDKTGAQLVIIPSSNERGIDLKLLEKALISGKANSTTVMCLTHNNTNDSLIQPAEIVGKMVRKHDGKRGCSFVYILDSC
jgi:cysteine desulfurase / selenocysteine lyase